MDRRRWAVIVTSVGIIMPLLDVTIVNIALPTLQRDLHAGFATLQWVVNAYSIPLAVFLVTAGKLADLYGRKRFFLLGLAVFSVGSAWCALTLVVARLGIPPVPVLLVGRAMQGIGGAALLPVTLAIVNEAFHEHENERVRVIGVRGAMSGLGLALGPLVGGVLLSAFDWTSIFWLNVPIGIATIAVAARTVDESRDPHASPTIDWAGAVLLSVAVFAVVLGLVLIDAEGGKLSPRVDALLGGGLALGALFVVVELRIREPLYDLRLFANRSFSGAAATVFLLSAALLALLFFLTLYLQNVLRLSPVLTGCALLPLTALTMAVAPAAGRAMTRFGPRPLVTGGMLAAAGGVALLQLIPGDPRAANWPATIAGFLLIGSGMGLVNAPTIATATGTAGHEKAGLAAGINAVCRQIGVAMGIALVGAFLTVHFDRTLVARLPATEAYRIERAGTVAASAAHGIAQRVWLESFHLALAVAAALLALGALVALLTLRKEDLPATDEAGELRKTA